MNISEAFGKYNLAIRKLPKEVVSRSIVSENLIDERRKQAIETMNKKPEINIVSEKLTIEEIYKSSPKRVIDRLHKENPSGYMYYLTETRIIKDGGKYLCKEVNDNGSITHWDKSRCFVSDTLQGSVDLFLKTKNKGE